MSLLQEGQLIRDGDYCVERFIGAGFFAEVYRVEHRILGRQALKIFKTPGTLEEVGLMLGEARLLTRFGHPNVIRVYDAGLHKAPSGTHGFFTMEYFPGGSLATYRLIHKERLAPVSVTLDILRQVCRGLSLAHASDPPLVHRDIKPQNILVEKQVEMPRVCISDFGLAKHVNPLMLKASTKGTPSYRAPECHDDPQASSRAADVYSIGLTAYLMLTDRFPYTGADLDEIKLEHFKRPLYPASRINGGVDEQFDSILARALAVDPTNRYPHVMALLADLESYCSKDVPPLPEPIPEPTPVNASAEQEAQQMIEEVKKLSRSNPYDAANLLEKTMNLFPLYREKFKGWLKALREGKRM